MIDLKSTPQEVLRIYADTSVFGGVFDPEFQKASRQFFQRVTDEKIHLLVSPVVSNELRDSPPWVKDFFSYIIEHRSSVSLLVDIPDCAQALRDAFLREGVVSERSMTDALHVAVATVLGCHVIVSWNCKHIVQLSRILQYNKISVSMGYNPIAIQTPSEVLDLDDKGF